jgi:hypothetical protein
MNRERHQTEEESEPLSLQDRLFAGLLAPLAFNLSLFIVLMMFSRHSRGFAKLFLYQTYWHGILLFVSLVLLPALAGFLIGTNKIITLLGHFFYTNMEHERDMSKTILAWLALFAVTSLLSQLL